MKPERVRQAQLHEDTAYLSAAGKKGAEVANNNRERERTEEEILAELAEEAAALEELERMRATNEDVLTPDGEDPYNKD